MNLSPSNGKMWASSDMQNCNQFKVQLIFSCNRNTNVCWMGHFARAQILSNVIQTTQHTRKLRPRSGSSERVSISNQPCYLTLHFHTSIPKPKDTHTHTHSKHTHVYNCMWYFGTRILCRIDENVKHAYTSQSPYFDIVLFFRSLSHSISNDE